MRELVIIPARGGSKGIPGKNIKPLAGRPLIYYTLDAACEIADHAAICVSTDSDEIIEKVQAYGLQIPFKRPSRLAGDEIGTYPVLLHALEFYGHDFDRIIVLQPTSPFRTAIHIREARELFRPDLDMVASVKQSSANPYFNLFEEDQEGYLRRSGKGSYARRQDCPPIYELNGAIYVINPRSLEQGPPSSFSRIQKYVMPAEDSIDIDSPFDWRLAEWIMQRRREQHE